MELKLKINSKNIFPRGGILIKGASVGIWIHEIQHIGLNIDAVKVFPVPAMRANELFGCLIVFDPGINKIGEIGKNTFYQVVANKLFIPENTSITPKLKENEWPILFSEHYHLLHPEIGLVELNEEVNWIDLIVLPISKETLITEPSRTVLIPHFITSMRIEVDQEKILEDIENPVSEEEMIEKLPFNMQKLLNGNNREMDKFLAYLDKNPEMAMKLGIPLDTLGTGRGGYGGRFTFNTSIGNVFNFAWIQRFFDNLSSGGNATGFFRYGFVLLFVLLARSCKGAELKSQLPSILVFSGIVILVIFIILLWAGSLSGSSVSPGGGSFQIDSKRFNTLQSRYEKLAEDYIAHKQYEKASHIYLKLLKNNHKAATVLEEGKLYREAGAVYLKYLRNKNKAAECNEKGHAYKEAIALYKELNEDEKVGDLYVILNDKVKANKYFEKVIENYKTNFQYVKASLVYKNKIGDCSQAQDLLMEGWRANKDAGKCLNNYFANTNSAQELSMAIQSVYQNDVAETNVAVFFHLLKHEFTKYEELEEMIKNMAYEIAAGRIDKNPDIASELLHFNKENKSMLKDVMKYKLKLKK